MTAVCRKTNRERSCSRALTKLCDHELLGMLVKSLLLLCHVCAATPGQGTSHRHQVLRLYFRPEDDLHLIRQLQVNHSLDPWQEARGENSSGDYLVPPQHVHGLRERLDRSHIPYKVLIPDAERFLQENDPLRSRKRERRSTSAHDFRHKFLSYTELRHFLRHVRNTATNARVELDSIGRSFEGRPTPYVKISSLNDSSTKGTIFIDGGIHGREWISPALTVEIIHRLAFNVENDSSVVRLLTMFNWIIVPLVNPDGYAYTFTPGFENRMWRKSRSTSYSNDFHCYGVDINRNFGFHWNNSPIHGGSSNPCSGTFSGPRSFSEPESRNLRNVLLRNSDTIKAYLSFHSFGQFFLYPWGYSSDVDIEDEDDLLQVASAFSRTMMAKNYKYSVGGSAKVLYPAAGGSDDYVRGTVGVKYAYTVELPPHETSRYGFLLPETLVSAVVSDTWDGIKAFALRLNKHLQSKVPVRVVIKLDSPQFSHLPSASSSLPNSAYKTEIASRDTIPDDRTGYLNSNVDVDVLQRIQHRPASHQVQSLWTPRPMWFSHPRQPSDSLRETSSRDIITAFVGKH